MTLTDASHVRNTGPLEQQTITETLLQDERAPASALPTITMAEGRMHLDLSLDAAIMIDALGSIVLVNEQAATLFGYGQDELNGQQLEVLLPERFHAAHMAHRHTYATAPLRRPMGVSLDLMGRRKDGSEFPVEISLRPILLDQALHVIGAIRDVTAQRLLECERVRLVERLVLQSTLINLAYDAILVRDPINRLLSWSCGAEALYGWTETEALGRVSHLLLKTHFPVSRAVLSARLESEGYWEGELRHTRRDGSVVTVESRQVLFRDERGVATAILEIHRDITQRRKLEQAQTAIHAEYFKDEFISIAAHELRQPLAVLKAAVGTLVLQTARGHGPRLAEWQQEMLEELEQATDRLSALTEDLLDVSRLQDGQLVLQRVPTNLVSLVQRLVERFQKTTTRHQLAFHPQQPSLEAAIDPPRMEQVISNLLTNAIKYSPQGGSIVVTVGTDGADHAVEIRVQDGGIGIPLHQQARIFGRFMRADNARAAGISGTGLGLYLCRALVEQHAGRLWFESGEGEGTTFFVTIPLHL